MSKYYLMRPTPYGDIIVTNRNEEGIEADTFDELVKLVAEAGESFYGCFLYYGSCQLCYIPSFITIIERGLL